MTRRRFAGASQALRRRVPKGGEMDHGVFSIEFSPHMYIRSSPRGPNRDPNRTLSNELLLLLDYLLLKKVLIIIYRKFN